VDRYGPQSILVTSFSRAAAAEEDSEMEKGGDELLQRLNRYRGLILPVLAGDADRLRQKVATV
jgi:hypothetical protein